MFTTPQTVALSICVEREDEERDIAVHPGEHTGAITIVDPRLPYSTVTFSMSLSYPNYLRTAFPIFLVVAVGAVYLMILRRAPDRDAQQRYLGLHPRQLHRAMITSGGPAARSGPPGTPTRCDHQPQVQPVIRS